MRIDVLLVLKGLCKTRQEAKEAIIRGAVSIDGAIVNKQSKDVPEDSRVEVAWSRRYVSRGGEKIEGVFTAIFGDDTTIKRYLTNKSALDIGSSTGGFTDFLLQHGVENVTCVDVGSMQLHDNLRGNQKIELYENTDIRNFDTEKKYNVIVGDVSFIQLEMILQSVLSFGAQGSFFCLLIKPQFEVGKGNTKKGIVKDAGLVNDVLDKYRDIVTGNQASNVNILPSVVVGGDGNQEYFLTFTI
jgi:23S rRNA (cytidine1920-2'-O)/16S rRNA (cytidine1409-2'-O)-methyltransferase